MSERDPGSEGLSYKQAGVDIAAADAFVASIGRLARATHNAGVVSHTSAYAGLFRPDLSQAKTPLIAATCDGVGTKLLVARDMQRFEGLGQDLVAMNVNDLLPSGARPLLFLDYIATGRLEPQSLEAVVRGIAKACAEVGCVLLGGETAEMPGLYAQGDFDLAGFAVGLADEAHLPDASSIRPGDVVLGLSSSGVHSNGLSLARKALLERGGFSLERHFPELGRSLGEELLEPTRLYVNQVLDLLRRTRIKAAAHITGGGLLGRAHKLAPEGMRVVLDQSKYAIPPIFELIRDAGAVAWHELASTFNMGLGFLVVVDRAGADVAREQASSQGWVEVGVVTQGTRGVDLGYAQS